MNAMTQQSYQQAMQNLQRAALDRVQQWGKDQGIAGLLETMEAMQAEYDAGTLSGEDHRAFRLAYNGFAALFAPLPLAA